MLTSKEILHQFGAVLLEDLRARVPKATGRTEQSIGADFNDNGFQIFVPVYFQALITGRKPTSSGASSGSETLQQRIYEWLRAKGVTPRPNKKGKVPTLESLSWAISKSIHQKGTLLYRLKSQATFLDGWWTEEKMTTLKSQLGESVKLQITSDLHKIIS